MGQAEAPVVMSGPDVFAQNGFYLNNHNPCLCAVRSVMRPRYLAAAPVT